MDDLLHTVIPHALGALTVVGPPFFLWLARRDQDRHARHFGDRALKLTGARARRAEVLARLFLQSRSGHLEDTGLEEPTEPDEDAELEEDADDEA